MNLDKMLSYSFVLCAILAALSVIWMVVDRESYCRVLLMNPVQSVPAMCLKYLLVNP